MRDITMPKYGLTMEDATILRWLKAAGEDVNEGEPILEIETDKVVVEVPAPASGRLAEQCAAEGDVVRVGELVGRIEDTGGSA
jgi:pyruvate/2-oxoglutarate dehydrogenase complex dihydrolipoamide acyltransferase (E2) component